MRFLPRFAFHFGCREKHATFVPFRAAPCSTRCLCTIRLRQLHLQDQCLVAISIPITAYAHDSAIYLTHTVLPHNAAFRTHTACAHALHLVAHSMPDYIRGVLGINIVYLTSPFVALPAPVCTSYRAACAAAGHPLFARTVRSAH